MQEHLEITPHRLALATTYNAIKVVPTVVDSWLLNRRTSKNLVTLGADYLSLLTFILKLARNRASTQRPIYTVIATSGEYLKQATHSLKIGAITSLPLSHLNTTLHYVSRGIVTADSRILNRCLRLNAEH